MQKNLTPPSFWDSWNRSSQPTTTTPVSRDHCRHDPTARNLDPPNFVAAGERPVQFAQVINSDGEQQAFLHFSATDSDAHVSPEEKRMMVEFPEVYRHFQTLTLIQTERKTKEREEQDQQKRISLFGTPIVNRLFQQRQDFGLSSSQLPLLRAGGATAATAVPTVFGPGAAAAATTFSTMAPAGRAATSPAVRFPATPAAAAAAEAASETELFFR